MKYATIIVLTLLACVSLVYGSYTEIFTSPSWTSTGYVRVGDTDNDGLNEIVLSSYNHVAIYSYVENSFSLDDEWTLDSVQAAHGIGIGDSDNDGSNELIFGTWAEYTNPDLVYFFNGQD